MEISAAVRMFNKSIRIVHGTTVARIEPGEQSPEGEPIYFYYTGDHYDFLEPVN